MSFNRWAVFFAVLNGIAAVIGLIAVFYPSIFNLEGKYEKLKLTVNTGKEFDQFLNFFEARMEDNKPFIIDTYLCKDYGEPAKFKIKNRDYKDKDNDSLYYFNTYRSDLNGEEFEISNMPYLEDFSHEELESFLKENASTVEEIFGENMDQPCAGLCLNEFYRFPASMVEEGYNHRTVGDCATTSAYHIKGSLIYDGSGSSQGELVNVFREATPIDFQTQE